MKTLNFKLRGRDVLNNYEYNVYYHKDELTEDSYVDGFEDGCIDVLGHVNSILKELVDRKTYLEFRKKLNENLGC